MNGFTDFNITTPLASSDAGASTTAEHPSPRLKRTSFRTQVLQRRRSVGVLAGQPVGRSRIPGLALLESMLLRRSTPASLDSSITARNDGTGEGVGKFVSSRSLHPHDAKESQKCLPPATSCQLRHERSLPSPSHVARLIIASNAAIRREARPGPGQWL